MTTTKFIPSKAQANYFEWLRNGEGSAIVEAVAGSGKTTTIVHGIEHMLGSIIFCAYNKAIADEVKARIVPFKNAEGSTIHSFGFSALRYAIKGIRTDDNKVYNLIDLWGEENPEKLEWLKPLKAAIKKTVSMAKQRGLGALQSATDRAIWVDMIEHFDLDEAMPETNGNGDANGNKYSIDDLIRMSQLMLARSNELPEVIDFDDMIYLPLQRNLRTRQFDWVMVDEAQDTNPTRRALLRKMLRPGGRLVAVGDPHQAIYGFTGCDNDALDQIAREFKCTRLPLSVSYRCPRAVVKHAQQWVSHIQAHENAAMGAVENSEYDGMISTVASRDAILCRYNKPLVETCFKLIRLGKGAKMEGRAIGQGLVALATKWKLKKLDALRSKLETYLGREVEKALAKKQEDKADRITDQVETLYVLIDRTLETGKDTVEDLKALIADMFDDNVSKKGLITCASVHKSKGREWEKVYLLGREVHMPSKFARQDWQMAQEINLIYVAVTRATQTLVEVTAPVKKKEGE